MSITSTDLKLFASAYPLDTDYGGGGMISTVVQNGTENNLFPDIDAAARAGGRVQLRKVYAAVTSADTDVFSGAQISVKVKPTDAAVGIVAFAFGDQTTLRKAAADKLAGLPLGTVLAVGVPFVNFPNLPYSPQTPASYTTYASISATTVKLGGAALANGTLVGFYTRYNAEGERILLATGIVVSAAGVIPDIVTTLDMRGDYRRVLPYSADWAILGFNLTSVRGCAAVASTAVSTASGIEVPVESRIVPNVAVYPAVADGIDPSGLAPTLGKVPIFRVGDTVGLRNGATTETAQVLFVDYRGALTFTAALANSYPIGSTVSALLQLGDMQPVVAASFSQQTWTRVFSDSIIGNTISANYNRVAGTITTSNLGAATERWAIVFTSATAFKLIGEVVGQIATGDTATAFLPLNPITATPYFTIPTAGWGAGWATGNVLRFNTVGSRAPFWVARTVSPSAVGAVLDGSTLEIRGTINA